MEAMRRSLAPEQEHLMHFLQERFQSIAEAASFLGGGDGLEAVLDLENFAAQLKRSGYLRPPEPLFRLLCRGRDRIKVLDILQFVSLPEEPMPQEEAAFSGVSRSRVTPQLPSAIHSRNSSLRLQATPGTSHSLEYTLPAQSLVELERELASMRTEMASLHERAARANAAQADAQLRAAPDETILQEAAALRAEGAELRGSLSEALRLLAEERKERLNDRTEAARRHKDLEAWAEDRIRGVETLATESRESTAEIKTSVQEALQLGELSEMRTLGAVAEESRHRSLTFQREQKMREAVTTELETRFRKMVSEERASRFQESAALREHLARVEDNLAAERNTQAKKLESMSALVEKVAKELEAEKDTTQVQLREVLNRQDNLRSSLVDGTREIREIEDDQTRHVSQIETAVAALTERVDQEIMSMRQGMFEIRQQLHTETSSREDSCNLLLGRLEGEAKTRLEAVEQNSQLHGDLQTRLENSLRAMLHDESVSRGEALAALESRTAALQQELNFEKAKVAAQGRDVAQSIAQLREAISSETHAKFEEVDAAFKSAQQVAGADQQGRLQAVQHLEAMISKNSSDVYQERSLREEQHALTGGRLAKIDEELEDVRLSLREALQRCEELRSAHESASHIQAERHAEATGTEISLKELKVRMEHLQQVCDSRERASTQKITELLSAIENEAKERAIADDEVLRKQSSAKEALPAMLVAERHRTDAALAKLEEVLRQEDVAERQTRHQAISGLELRWQQLREATEESLKHRVEQQSGVSLEVSKVSEALMEESRARQQEHKVLANDLQRLGQEVAEAAYSRRSVEEGLREQQAQMLKRLDQAGESQHKQECNVALAFEEVRKSVASEATARELAFSQLHKDFQNDVLVKEELLSAANKGIQRVGAKITEDLRIALRDETRDREELRSRLEQHVIDVREAFGEMKAISEKREAEMADEIRKASEALGDDMRGRKERDQQVHEAFAELHRELASEAAERRAAADGLVGRLQHMEASMKEEAAAREEVARRLSRELVQSQARLQEEKALREDSLSKLEQAVSLQVTSLENTLYRDFKSKEEALAQALAPLQKNLKAQQVAREEEARNLATKLQGLVTEQQMEREERSRLLRDVNASLAKLQRMQAEEEDARNQEHERLGGALESLQEAVRSLKQTGEETRQRSQEVADHLRSLISRESTARLSKFEAVEATVREVRSLVTAEAQQREAAVRGLSAEITTEIQAREESAGRERRSMEEEVGRAIREHRKSREEEERKVHERLLELQANLSDEREQRLEAVRMERLKVDELKEELQGQRKIVQRDLDKFTAVSKRMDELSSHLTKETEGRLQSLSKSCEDLRLELASDMQRSGTAWRQLEGKVTELEAAFRAEVRDRKELQAELRRSLDAEIVAREEGLATEKRAREASDAQLDEICKVSILEERSQRSMVIEDCRKDLASIKGRLAEDGARREHETSERQFELQKMETALAELHRDRSVEASRLRDSLEQLKGEVLEGSRALRDEVHKLDARCLADRATAEGIGRIAREQAMGLEAAIQGVHEDVTREAEERCEAVRRLEGRIAEERRYLDSTATTQLRAIEDRLRAAEDNARLRLQDDPRKPGAKAAASLSKAVADLDARCESVRATVGAVQSGLAEVQQKQSRTAEVETLVAQAREELRKESQDRKAEGSQLSTQLIEHAERLEWAEQQRLKAANELLQEVMETRSELKREMRDREDGHSKVLNQLRDEATRREEALEREARMRLEGEERAAQALQAAIREERRLRVQSEMRLEGFGKALASSPKSGDDRLASAILDASAEEQTRLKQQLTELQARVASSEARQKTAEERTVSMLDAIMNGLMSNET